MYTIEDFMTNRSLYVMCRTTQEVKLLRDYLSLHLKEDEMGPLMQRFELPSDKTLAEIDGAAYRFGGCAVGWNLGSALERWRRQQRDGTYTKEISVWELLGIQNNRFSEEEFMKMLEV